MTMQMKNNKDRSLRPIIMALTALCLVFIGLILSDTSSAYAATTTTGSAVTWNASVTGINSVQIKYTTEDIIVEAASRVYYAVIKKNSATGVKVAELIPASNGGSGNTYLIDFSTISASKEAYIGITTATAAGSDGLVPVTTISLAPTQRKIVFNLNWGAEGTLAQNYSIFQSVDVTGSDAVQTSYVLTPSGSSQKPITNLSIQWRKGANAPWRDITELTNMQWESMKSAGSVLYFRTGAADSAVITSASTGSYEIGNRYSKEIKVKMNITKASAVKLDVSKMTVSLKNGVQFRASVSGSAISADLPWYTVLPYSASSTKTDSPLRSVNDTTQFNPFTENTQVKVSYMSINDIRSTAAAGVGADQSVILEVRIAATTKKAASRTSIITIPPQAAAPTATVSAGDKGITVSTITAAVGDTASQNFEFTLAKKEDVTPTSKLDFAQMKWSSIKSGTVLKTTAKATYTNTDKARRTVLITDADAVLLIRRKGISASSKTAAVLASDYAAIEVPHTAAASPAPTGGAEVSGTPTPTGGAAASGTPTPTGGAVASGTPTPTGGATASGTPAPTDGASASGTPAPTGGT